MRSLARVGLLLVGIACSLVLLYGVLRFMTELGVSPVRFLIEDALVALAGAAGLTACVLGWRRVRAAAAQATAVRPAFEGSRLEAGLKPMRVFGIVLLGAALSGLGWLMFNASMSGSKPVDVTQWLSGLALIASGLGCLAWVWSMYRPGRASLLVDGSGIDHPWFGLVPWNRVHGIHLQHTTGRHESHSLVLRVSQPGQFLGAGRLPGIFASRARKEARMGALQLPLDLFKCDPALIHEAALKFRNALQLPLLAAWHPMWSEAQAERQGALQANLSRMEEINASIERGEPIERFQSEMRDLSEAVLGQAEATRDEFQKFQDTGRRHLAVVSVIGVLLLIYLVWRMTFLFLRG